MDLEVLFNFKTGMLNQSFSLILQGSEHRLLLMGVNSFGSVQNLDVLSSLYELLEWTQIDWKSHIVFLLFPGPIMLKEQEQPCLQYLSTCPFGPIWDAEIQY